MPRSIKPRVRANRQNAKKSTGPRTTEGKARSRLNALKHGILAESVVIPNCEQLESAEKFNALHNDLTEELNPVGMIEEMLVETIAVSYWRLRRALRMEAAEISIRVDNHENWNSDEPIGRASLPTIQKTHMILRYETTIERRLHRVLSSLYLHQARRKANAASNALPLTAQRPDSSQFFSSSDHPFSYSPQKDSQTQSDHPYASEFKKLPNEANSTLHDEQHSFKRE